MLENLVYKELHDEFEELFKEYSDYNAHTNLSSIKDKDEVFQKHFIDSLAPLLILDKLVPKDTPLRVLDIGTGGGFPALPLAIARKDFQIVAIDSTGKKIKFVNETASKLKLTNLTAMTARAEDLAHDPKYRESFDLVVSRAVAESRILIEICGAFIKPSGFFIAYKKTGIEEELANINVACKKLGLELNENFLYAKERQLLIFKKMKASQEKYPRNGGVLKKSPL